MPHPIHLRPTLLLLLLVSAALGWSALGWAGAAQQATPARPSPAQTRAQTPALPLRASGAWVVAMPPGIRETSVFGTLINSSARPVVLRGATTPHAAHAMLMNTTTTGTMTGMEAAQTLTVPARGRLVLGDLGAHVMLMGLKRPLKVGETVKVTLRATDGRSLVLNATVRKP